MVDIEVVGLCKECVADITTLCRLDEYTNVYECPECGYPNTLGDMWDKDK
jgi:DNA-directed RNA polymerase subunit RPC12/RpoP